MNKDANQNQGQTQNSKNPDSNQTNNINQLNQIKQVKQISQSSQGNQNKQVQPQKKPAPPGSPNNNININNNNNISSRPKTAAPPAAKNANMSDRPFDTGATRTFNTNDIDIKPGQTNAKGQQARRSSTTGRTMNSDGTYHMTGGNIKSNRQRVTNSNSTRNDSRGFTVSPNKNKRKNKTNADDENSRKSGFIMSGILKVVIYIAGVVIIAGILASNIIMIANDVFAFVKTPAAVSVTIPEGADIEEISQILHDNGLIKYPKIFNIYANYKRKDKVWEFQSGTYPISSTLNYDEFISEFRIKAAAREVVTITIPEGFTIDQIIDTFIAKGIGTRDKFVEVINTVDFSEYGYRFLKPLYENKDNLSPDRKYLLEGYLFPDTYDFYRDENELNIIIRFLNNFNIQFTEDCYKNVEILDESYMEAVGRHFTIDDAVTLASITQREAKFPEDFERIAAVFHNRLTYSASFPYLQSDATVLYDYAEHKADLTQADLAIDSPYNTYTRQGLTPSAVCNPGYEAIFAALWPDENSLNTYFFFIAELDGHVTYSETSAQHEAHRERIRNEKAALPAETTPAQ